MIKTFYPGGLLIGVLFASCFGGFLIMGVVKSALFLALTPLMVVPFAILWFLRIKINLDKQTLSCGNTEALPLADLEIFDLGYVSNRFGRTLVINARDDNKKTYLREIIYGEETILEIMNFFKIKDKNGTI